MTRLRPLACVLSSALLVLSCGSPASRAPEPASGPWTPPASADYQPGHLFTPVAAPAEWKGAWIWTTGEERPWNSYRFFRKTFDLTEVPPSAPARVCGDSRYKLWINGVLVGRGPIRSDRRWQSYDTIDIAPYLQRGKNCVAALVHHFGHWTFSYMLGRGGLLFEADIHAVATTSGRDSSIQLPLATDATWKALRGDDIWTRDLPRMCVQQAFTEICDGRRLPAGWTEPGFDDSKWENAAVIGRPPGEPWTRLVPREIPPLQEHDIFPESVYEVAPCKPLRQLHGIGFDDLLDPKEHGAAYALTFVKSPSSREVEVHLGSDDGVKCWVNDELVIQHKIERAATPDQEIAKVALKEGWNKVLVKVVQVLGPWQLYFRLVGDTEGIVYSVYQDSPPPGGPALGGRRGAMRVDWVVIGPFDSPQDPAGLVIQPGFDEAFPPEKELDLTKTYTGKGGRSVGWISAGHTLQDDRMVSVVMGYEGHRESDTARKSVAAALLDVDEGRTFRTRTSADGDASIVLDFGREVTGYPRIHIANAQGGEVIDLGYSECLVDPDTYAPLSAADLKTKRGKVNPDRNGIHYADRYICRPGPQVYSVFDKRAFRYLQVDVRNAPDGIEIDGVALRFSTYPARLQPAFECSDERLNQIWRAGAYTLNLNMEDAVTDCPWRERGAWWGDARVSFLGHVYAFGDVALMRRMLRLHAQGQDARGMTWGVYPTDWEFGRLPDFTLIWVFSLWDYYVYTGDEALVRELYPVAQRALHFFENHVDRHGLIGDVPGFWIFIDWTAPGDPTLDKFGEMTALNSYYVRSLAAGAAMARLVGDAEGAALYDRQAARVKRAINERLWDDAEGAYRDCRDSEGDRISPKISQQANSLAILFGVAPPDRAARALTRIYDPAKEKETVRPGSPYFSFYALAALYTMGRHEQALPFIRKRWGELLDWGATTYWERWQPDESMCHGWAAGPVVDLPAEFLGVRPLSPGWAEFEIAPHPCGLAWAKGTITTVRGPVRVAWLTARDAVGETFELRCTVPEGTLARPRLPILPLVNDRPIRVDGLPQQRVPEILGPGEHVIRGPALPSPAR